ncbi:MAG: serine/threonine-protein kinase, partial [Planctomycetota bacterium]
MEEKTNDDDQISEISKKRLAGEAYECPSLSDLEADTISSGSDYRDELTQSPNSDIGSATRVDRVGEYDLLEEIARGGMGVVYRAKHRNLNRISAVKMILSGQFSSANELQRFRIESESAAKLDHPAIVPIYEIGEDDGRAFFAMKYVDGGSLASSSHAYRDRPREIAELMRRVAEGVHHAHQRGVLHRDLKPANILLDKNGDPYITDLGLAKSTSGGSDLTHTGAVLGTPGYMPPEQASAQPVTTAADVYSLGAILYELLVGHAPYRGDTGVNILVQVIDGPPPPPSRPNPTVDRDLELVCLKAMERNPEDRYSSAQQFAEDLQCWLSGSAMSVKPPTIRALVSNWVKQNQRLTYAVFALIMGIMVCAPIVISFFSENAASIYDRFPDKSEPLLFSIQFPRWLSILSVIFLFFVLWPLIGLLNAAISKPVSLTRSIWSGVSTAGVLSLIFYCLIGWLIFLQGANKATRHHISIIANAAWPDSGLTKDTAMDRANRLFGGMDEIPEEQRAGAVTQRIKSDIFASATISFSIGLSVVFAFSIPIVYGTVMGYLLQNRRLAPWVFLLRYTIAWWSVSCVLIALIPAISALVTQDVRFLREANARSHFWVTLLVSLAALTVVWLTLRRWKKPESNGNAIPAIA